MSHYTNGSQTKPQAKLPNIQSLLLDHQTFPNGATQTQIKETQESKSNRPAPTIEKRYTHGEDR